MQADVLRSVLMLLPSRACLSGLQGDWLVPWRDADEGKRGIPMVHNGFK